MAELKLAMDYKGIENARTYIQSGNLIFESEINDTDKLAKLINGLIRENFKLEVGVAVFSKAEWKEIIGSAPTWWGKDMAFKHNLLVMIKPYKMKDVLIAIGTLKPEIEKILPGKGVFYQSLSIKLFGRTSTSKLVSDPVYKKMTIRNYNTATKLLALLN